jgi:hypothetical protein
VKPSSAFQLVDFRFDVTIIGGVIATTKGMSETIFCTPDSCLPANQFFGTIGVETIHIDAI